MIRFPPCVLLLAVLAGALGCSSPYGPAPPDLSLLDYVHHNGVQAAFWPADRLKYERSYREAAAAFRQLPLERLSRQERWYVLNQLAYCLLAVRADDSAKICLREIEAGPLDRLDAGALADYHYNKGLSLFRGGAVQPALDTWRAAAGEYERLYGVDHLRYAQTINQIGLLHYQYAMSFDSALRYIPRAYELFLAHPEWEQYRQENEFGMALISQSQRDHSPAEEHCTLALQLAGKAPFPDTVFMAQCWNFNGNMLKKRKVEDTLQERRNHENARSLFGSAIRLARLAGSGRLAEFLVDSLLNELYFDIREDELLAWVDSLRARQALGYAHPDRLLGYYYYMYRHRKSIDSYQRLLLTQRHNPSRIRGILDEIYHSLGVNYLALNNYDSAFVAYRDKMLLGTPYEGKDLTLDDILQPDIYQSYQFNYRTFANIAEVLLIRYKAKGNPADLRQAGRLCALADSLTPVPSPTEGAILTYQQEAGDKFYEVAMESVWLQYQQNPQPALLDQALRYSERMKSYILFRDMQSVDTVDQWLQKKRYYDWLKEQKGQLTPEERIHYTKVVEALKKEQGDWEKYHPLDSILKIAYVQRKLDPGQSLVTYCLDKSGLYGIYVEKDSAWMFCSPAVGLPARIDRTLEQLQNWDRVRVKEWMTNSHILYQALVEPFAYRLNRRQLLVVPDRKLNQLPFEALVTDTTKQVFDFSRAAYLLYQAQISYTPSWKVYVQGGMERKKLPDQFRILAYTYGNGKELKPSEDLLARLRASVGKRRMCLAKGRRCRKRHFLRCGSRYDVLHFSVHGESSTQRRMDNKLLLGSFPNYDTLYGFEILTGAYRARLAVIGACESGSGASEWKEGAFSLARNFLLAGVPVVISSLWKIKESATADLLEFFYAHLEASKDPAYALHQAKLDYLKSGDSFVRHPSLWSGLVCIE